VARRGDGDREDGWPKELRPGAKLRVVFLACNLFLVPAPRFVGFIRDPLFPGVGPVLLLRNVSSLACSSVRSCLGCLPGLALCFVCALFCFGLAVVRGGGVTGSVEDGSQPKSLVLTPLLYRAYAGHL
jgi:hypothetical protein